MSRLNTQNIEFLVSLSSFDVESRDGRLAGIDRDLGEEILEHGTNRFRAEGKQSSAVVSEESLRRTEHR